MDKHETILRGDPSAWLWSLDDIESWIGSFADRSADLGVAFVSLKRWLTEKIEDDTHARSMELTATFLDALGAWISEADLSANDLRLCFGILMTIIGEVGPYRYETKGEAAKSLLDPMAVLRQKAVETTKVLLARSEFGVIAESIEKEIVPLLEAAMEEFDGVSDRFMGFRIIQISKVAERMLELSHWLEAVPDGGHDQLIAILQSFYDMKYPRFGTSGLRGRWDADFTEIKARRTAQSICNYLADVDIPDYVSPAANDLRGKWIVIGFDGRRTSPKVAGFLAETALANGFKVYLNSRPTPTPAIAYFATEYIGKENIAGILNCTASHNPSEWQGIKFNPLEGYPAPTHLTNIVAERINEMQLLDLDVPHFDIEEGEQAGNFAYYDPMPDYWEWIKDNGNGNQRIPLDFERMKDYYGDKLILIDEMHGAGRGYMGHILGEMGLRHEILHARRDIDLGGLAYANPERPFIDPLIDAVRDREAAIGLGLDTDADRFGVVGEGGEFFRPNQVLAMLAYYLGHDRALEGRMVITQTGLPMIESIADHFPNIERPAAGAIPPYVDHPFYKRRVGERDDMVFKNSFVVPVGIKYIVEVPRQDTAYKNLPEDQLSKTWMDGVLLGGEESSGLTTRGHVPDKDGLWANLLIMDMVAYYGKPLAEIWKSVTEAEGGWMSYGGRVDVDASDNAKEGLINYYLDKFKGKAVGEEKMAGFAVNYAGGIRYDLVEVFLADESGDVHNFMRIRASGTEPINRVYTETKDPELWESLLDIVLGKLDDFTIEAINGAYRVENLADMLTSTGPRDWDRVTVALYEKLSQAGWTASDLVDALKIKRGNVEARNQKVIDLWLDRLG